MFDFYIITLYKYSNTKQHIGVLEMKQTITLLAIAALIAPAAFATEPLLLEPLSPTVLSTTPGVTPTQTTNTTTNGLQVSLPNQTGTYEATFTPASQMNPNMVPQNAAAEGKPVPEKKTPRVKVQTKQRSQGNAYWNAGGKGTKSFF